MAAGKLAIAFTVTSLFLATAISVDADKPEDTHKSKAEQETSDTHSRDLQKGSVAWEEALGHVRMLAARFQQYRDASVASKSVASLAAVVCPSDKALAHTLFFQAFELVQGRLRNEEDASKRNLLWLARSAVISSAAQCDPQFAAKLNEDREGDDGKKAEPDSFWADLRTAHELLSGDEASAVEFARALSRNVLDLKNTQLDHFFSLLWRLRRQTPSIADELFIQALIQIQQNPEAALRAVIALGNYVFGLAGAEDSDAIGVSPLGDQNDYRLYLFQEQRAGASPVAIQYYLATAVQVLSALSPTSQKDAAAGSALARQLFQRSQEIGPIVTFEFDVAAQRMLPLIQDSNLRAQVSRVVAAQPGESKISLELELEKTTDPQRRNEIRLMLFAQELHGLLSKSASSKEVSKAEGLAAAVEDDVLRDQLLSLAIFRRIQLALEKKDLEEAQALARTLRSPLQRALGLLGIAQQQERGENELSAGTLNMVLRVEKTNREQRPYLLVAAAIIAARQDIQISLRILEDAVAGFNQLEPDTEAIPVNIKKLGNKLQKPREPVVASSRGFVEIAYAGDIWRHFPLNIPGLSFDLSQASRALQASPPEHLTAVLFTLQSEARQGPALAVAAATYLERAKAHSVP